MKNEIVIAPNTLNVMKGGIAFSNGTTLTYLTTRQHDQIGRFIGVWATF